MPNVFDIIHEDSEIIVVNKLSAISVLPDKSGDMSLKDFINQLRPGKFLEPVHRLDRRTSGVIVFAKTKQSLAKLSQSFRDRNVAKTYWAVTENQPEPISGIAKHRLVHDSRRNVVKAFNYDASHGKIAELHYELLTKSDKYFLLEVTPLTGRTHQIRVQLSALGCPVRGDLKYGAKRSTSNGLIMLHARAISFDLRQSRLEIVADPPRDEPLWNVFAEEPQNFV